MAVELLFYTVVLRRNALPGLRALEREIAEALFRWEPDWHRADEHLSATTFMAPRDVRAFGQALEARTGLRRTLDWAVADVVTGPLGAVPWLEWAGGLGGISGAWRAGLDPGLLERVPALLPGLPQDSSVRVRVAKLFGRDHPGDPVNYSRFPEDAPPTWGGCDLWGMADPASDPEDDPARPSMVSMAFDHVDFMAWGEPRTRN